MKMYSIYIIHSSLLHSVLLQNLCRCPEPWLSCLDSIWVYRRDFAVNPPSSAITKRHLLFMMFLISEPGAKFSWLFPLRCFPALSYPAAIVETLQAVQIEGSIIDSPWGTGRDPLFFHGFFETAVAISLALAAPKPITWEKHHQMEYKVTELHDILRHCQIWRILTPYTF